MARAKRLNAEKVTISIDSDVLLFAKHKALDLRMTLSDYIQSLVRVQQEKKVVVKSEPKKPVLKPAIVEEKDLGIPMFKDDSKPATQANSEPLDSIQSVGDARIMELKNEGITNRDIAMTMNNEGFKTPKGMQWNLENIKKRLQVINKAKGGNE